MLLVFLRASNPLPTLSDNRISLQCLQDFMLLEMDLQDIPKLEPTSLHLRHFSCRPQVTNTRAKFRVPFQGCGTTLGTDLNHLVYQNVVDNSQQQFNGSRVAVRHVPELHYPFACRYRQKYIVTLKEGQDNHEGNENGQNRTRKDTPADVSKSSSCVSNVYLHHLTCLCIGLQLLGTLVQAVH
ncbi:hypothetical protein OS493_034739 [Desmophyllum pertusum]|uniref:ZP domain-containing protein n=1 Tax=Desmophyllum pertusum TaxID=174260 RepID=A0A9W9YV19_9CNID|nr:hypothetical protein OS493_034739 [Desmophyllum pertusum]